MMQLILSIVLMYLVVGSAGYWGLKKRREQQLNLETGPRPSSRNPNRKQGAI